MCPERHLEAAEILGKGVGGHTHSNGSQVINSAVRSGADVRQVKRADAGAVLADTLRHFLFDLQVEDGLGAVGYDKDDIPALVKGTLPQVSCSPAAPGASWGLYIISCFCCRNA